MISLLWFESGLFAGSFHADWEVLCKLAVVDPRYTAVLYSAGFCFIFIFVGLLVVLFVLVGFYVVGWFVRSSLRWFHVCFQRLVVLDFVLLGGMEVMFQKPERVGYNNPKGSDY